MKDDYFYKLDDRTIFDVTSNESPFTLFTLGLVFIFLAIGSAFLSLRYWFKNSIRR
uniref:Uncharacterized protein n=1 Tax=viral metagenome TaxID=1070528 RepID=A0A6M3LQS5_9ZZZZ